MTPKEKAKQLIDELQFATIVKDNKLYYGINKVAAKEAAKILIQNILLHDKDIDTIPFSIYWGSVINEIDKL